MDISASEEDAPGSPTSSPDKFELDSPKSLPQTEDSDHTWSKPTERAVIYKALFIVEAAVLVGALLVGYIEQLSAVDAIYWAGTVITTGACSTWLLLQAVEHCCTLFSPAQLVTVTSLSRKKKAED